MVLTVARFRQGTASAEHHHESGSPSLLHHGSVAGSPHRLTPLAVYHSPGTSRRVARW